MSITKSPDASGDPFADWKTGPASKSIEPMTTASNIGYEPSGGTRAIAPGGIWAVHLLTRKVGLVQDIDRVLHLLKR